MPVFSIPGLNRRFRALLAPRRGTAAVVPSLVPVEVGKAPAASRLSLDQQWSRVAGVVTAASDGVETVARLQASAEQQLDSASYALQGLLRELSAVMEVPGAPSATIVDLMQVRSASAAGSGALAA